MNGYYDRYDVRIGLIADEFFYDAISSAAPFVYLSPSDDISGKLDEIDCLLVVSTWRGLLNCEWRRLAYEDSDVRQHLYRMIDTCHDKKIPTIFYSKEDPPHYAHFINIAKRCDFVWTSATEMIEAYKADCGHDRVAALSFCINPDTQNPMRMANGYPDSDSVIFSGTWMPQYIQRRQDLPYLFNGVLRSGKRFCVYNRRSSDPPNSKYRYPARFAKYLRPAMPHRELLERHKASSWALNVNTETRSTSMFSGRCFELSACGVNLISNYSIGLHRLLPEVSIAYTSDDVALTLRRATPSWMAFRRACAIRAVMSGHTCYDAIGKILSAAGFKVGVSARPVAVVVSEVDDCVREMFNAQTYSPRKLFSKAEFSRAIANDFYFVAEWSIGKYYNPYYLEDMINCFKMGEYGIVESSAGTVTRRGAEDGKRIFTELFELPDIEKKGSKDVAVVEIDVGDDRRRLLACTIASLCLSRYFSRLKIELSGLDCASPATLGVVRLLCQKYTNVSEHRDVSDLPRILLRAGDEILPGPFDKMLRKTGWFWVRKVVGASLYCDREVHTVADGISLRTGRIGLVSTIGSPVIVRHSSEENPPGPVWPTIPAMHQSFLRRCINYYAENGLLHIGKRILSLKTKSFKNKKERTLA